MSNTGWLLVGLIVVGVGALVLEGGNLMGYPWSDLPNYQTWAATIAAAESANGLPTHLLAALCYQESGYQSAVIAGTQPSSAGALGIAQLEPAYFSSVQVPTPFTAADVTAQIGQAAEDLAGLYGQFGNWPAALAAYNAGATTVSNAINGSEVLPSETQAYVAAITGYIPAAASGSSLPALSAAAAAAPSATGATGGYSGTGGTGTGGTNA